MRSDIQTHSSSPNISVCGGGVHRYNAKAHARRVADAADSPSAVIVLEGEKQAYYSGSDQPRHFRQDRYFYYLTGCNEWNCYVTYDVSKDFLTLWLPHTDDSRVFYDGRGSTPEEAMENYDVDDARYIMSGNFVAEYCQDKPVLTLSSSDILRSAMDACRAVKDHDEIELIREANRISSKAHREVLKQLSQLRTEPQAEGLFLNVCISAGAKEQAYGPIMGSGPNAGILHYQNNDQPFDDRQVLLIDASCEWQLYAADITRTMPLNRKRPGHWPSREAEAIYKAVEKVQEACIKLLGPGKQFIDVNWHAIHMTIDALLELGLLKGNHTEIFHTGTVGAFFPHGLGHHIGLEVHDMTPTRREHIDNKSRANTAAAAQSAYAEITSPRNQRLLSSSTAERFSLAQMTMSVDSPALEAGNVVTIEPGIYFNKFILESKYLHDPKHSGFIDTDVLERYMPVGGVRIEDDILITEKGYENLTGAVKGEEMLAVIRQSSENLK